MKNPYILKDAKPGEPSKYCRGCERIIPLLGFSKNKATRDGLSGYCSDCQYLQNTTGSPYKVVAAGPPLKRAYYEDRIIHGSRVRVRVIR